MMLNLNLEQKVGVVVAGGDPGWSFSFGLAQAKRAEQSDNEDQAQFAKHNSS
jgi:hypothetical protein